MDKTSIKQTRRLEKLNAIVSQKGGKCLSCIYKNSTAPLEWECKRGHTWTMKPSYVKDGSWCKQCKKMDILNGMKHYARSRGGKCLSKEFVTSTTKLLWECSDGHQWHSNSAKYNNSWCPMCANGFFLSEEKCRFILGTFTGKAFVKTRTILGQKLELDGYCDKLKIAFEYQGYQHFEKAYYYDDNSLENRKFLDAKKKILCKERNIVLLDIPYHVNVSDSALVEYILNQLKKYGVHFVTKTMNWDEFVSGASKIYELNQMAHKKGGRLISKSYRGYYSKLEFECQKHHKWVTSPGNIKLGSWCPKCNAEAISKRNRNSISDICLLARENNTALVSKEYKNNVTPLEWKCNQCLDIWHSTLNAMKTRLLKDKWCLFCNKQRKKNASKQTENTKCSTQEASYCP